LSHSIPDEITPAMIEAGMDAYYRHDIEEEGSREVLKDVYAAMRRLEVVDDSSDKFREVE
jgi:hypothetical protein